MSGNLRNALLDAKNCLLSYSDMRYANRVMSAVDRINAALKQDADDEVEEQVRSAVIRASEPLSPSPSVEGESSATAEDAARLILECTDIVSEATAKKLAERIRLLGTGSREERSQADLGGRRK